MPSPNSVAIAVRSLTDMQIRDLLNIATDNLIQAGQINLEWALAQESYPAVDGLLEDDKIVLDGGTNITRRITLDDAGGVQWCDLFDHDNLSVEDITYPFTMPWRSAKVGATWDRGEVARCAGKEQLYDLVKLRINAKLLAFCQSIENAAWTLPATPTTNALWGIPTWVVGITGLAVGIEGFYGCIPGGDANWTSLAGITPCTFATTNTAAPLGGKDRWRNWAAQYGAVNQSCLKQMRKAAIKTNFKPPRMLAGKIPSTFEGHRIYCNTDTQLDFCTLLEKRGDRAVLLDLKETSGEPVFKRAPIIAVPGLDPGMAAANAHDPIYMLNRRSFKFFAQHGEFMRISEATPVPTNHNMTQKWIDLTGQFVCLNRREQACLQKP